MVKEAHQGIYRGNYSLMEALGERLEGVGIPGYRQWMEVMAEWYQESRSQAQPGPASRNLTLVVRKVASSKPNSPQTDRESSDPASSGEETRMAEVRRPDQEEAGDQEEEGGTRSGKGTPSSRRRRPGEEEGLEEEIPPFAWKPEPGRLKVLLNLIPPWWKSPDKREPVSSPGGMGRDENGLTLIPIPDLKPDDLVSS